MSDSTSAQLGKAQITSVTLKIKYAAKVGTNPFNTHGKIIGDIRSSPFSGLRALELGDFAAVSSKNGAFIIRNTPVANWYSDSLDTSNFVYVNLAGWTQIRLRFQIDDNNDLGTDVLKFYSGDASPSLRPQLIVVYTTP